MEKYQVLMTLVIWYICCGVTTAMFQPGTYAMQETGIVPGVNPDSGNMWALVSFFIGGLWFGFNVPDCPPVLTLIITIPFYILLIYFIYLNLPTVKIFGNEISSKQP